MPNLILAVKKNHVQLTDLLAEFKQTSLILEMNVLAESAVAASNRFMLSITRIKLYAEYIIWLCATSSCCKKIGDMHWTKLEIVSKNEMYPVLHIGTHADHVDCRLHHSMRT